MSTYNIKVFGVGGGGSNTVDYIMDNPINDITSYAINTDAQALTNSKANSQIHIGEISTKGLGAGALPEVGRRAAEESKDILYKEIESSDIVFVAAGMGGGTGTGAAPYIARIAKSLGILTIGVVTKPFEFEGPSRMKMAVEGIRHLQDSTDITIVIPNEKLITNHREKFMEDAFVLPDDVLRTAIKSVVDMLENVSAFGSNVDLNALRSALCDKGLAVMGIGESADSDLSPQENLGLALGNAISSEILEISVHGARNFIIMVTANMDSFQYEEMDIPVELLSRHLGYDISYMITPTDDINMPEYSRKVTIIAVGFDEKSQISQVTEIQKPRIDDSIFSGL